VLGKGTCRKLGEGLLHGLVGGLVGTAAMTAAMVAMYQRLPSGDREPLPPRYIAMNVAHVVGLTKHLSQRQRLVVTLTMHFAYGTAAGPGYTLVTGRLPIPPLARGLLYGLLVYLGGYAGWLPLTGIYRSPRQESAPRNALTLVSHLVWGGTLAVVSGDGGS
jgi:uncharacterized membrane protein YagU involved in acid resistance